MISKIITAYQSYGLDILLKACVFLCDDIDSGKKPSPFPARTCIKHKADGKVRSGTGWLIDH